MHSINLTTSRATEFFRGDRLQLSWRDPSLLDFNSLFLHLSLLETSADCQLVWRRSQKTLFSRQHRMWQSPRCWLHLGPLAERGPWWEVQGVWLEVDKWRASLWTLSWSDHQNLLLCWPTCPLEAASCPGRTALCSHRLPSPHSPLKKSLTFQPRNPFVCPFGSLVWELMLAGEEVLSAAGGQGSLRLPPPG